MTDKELVEAAIKLNKQEIGTAVITVHKGNNKVEIKIPLGQRSVLSVGSDGAGKAALEMVTKMIDEIKRLDV